MSMDDEIADYYLWHPRQEPTGRHVLDITGGDKSNPPSLGDAFIGTLADRLKVKSGLTDANLRTARCRYFSDEEAEEWEDLWPFVWTLTFSLEDPKETLPPWQDEFLTLVGYDPDTLDATPSESTLALIYVDFEKPKDGQNFKTTLSENDDIVSQLRASRLQVPEITVYALYDYPTRVEIAIGPVSQEFFEQGNSLAEAIFAAVADCGGYANLEDRQIEVDEHFNETGLT